MALNKEAAITEALELTKKAIEFRAIKTDVDPVKGASNVYEFYNTLYNKFIENETKH